MTSTAVFAMRFSSYERIIRECRISLEKPKLSPESKFIRIVDSIVSLPTSNRFFC